MNQTHQTIAVLGGTGSFSQIAAGRLWPGARRISGQSLDEVCQLVKSGVCGCGLLPIENTTAGIIEQAIDAIQHHGLHIAGEALLPVTHHLLAASMTGTDNRDRLGKIRTVFSHPKAFEQCQAFLASRKHIRCVMVSDTSKAAQLVALHRSIREAAIGSDAACSEWGLTVLVPNIQSNVQNCTRFVIVQTSQNKRGNKVTLSVRLAHVPGSLLRFLTPITKQKLNIVSIVSRPLSDTPWEYRFFLDIDIGTNARGFSEAMDAARRSAIDLGIVGVYDKGVTV